MDIETFKTIDHNDGLALIRNVTNYSQLESIVRNLAENKNKYTYKIYEYIITNTQIDYYTEIDTGRIDHTLDFTSHDAYMVYGKLSFIHLCAIHGNIYLLEYLIQKDINVNFKTETTPLIVASSYSNNTSSNETVRLLLENGANVDLSDNDGFTALMEASFNSGTSSSIETIRLLLEYGAEINMKDSCGATALSIASCNTIDTSSIDTVQLLLEFGAEINLQDMNRDTALMGAVSDGSLETMELLIDYGADYDLQDILGNTALMFATRLSNIEAVKLLLTRGANPHLKNERGQTAYDYAETDEIKDLIKSYYMTLTLE